METGIRIYIKLWKVTRTYCTITKILRWYDRVRAETVPSGLTYLMRIGSLKPADMVSPVGYRATNIRTNGPICVKLLGHQPEECSIHYPNDQRRVTSERVAVLTKHRE